MRNGTVEKLSIYGLSIHRHPAFASPTLPSAGRMTAAPAGVEMLLENLMKKQRILDIFW